VKSYYAPVDHLMLLDQLAISIAGAEAGDPSLPKAHSLYAVRAGGGCRRHRVGMARATGRPFLPGAGTQAAMEAP
jgi:hypothetical protein